MRHIVLKNVMFDLHEIGTRHCPALLYKDPGYFYCTSGAAGVKIVCIRARLNFRKSCNSGRGHQRSFLRAAHLLRPRRLRRRRQQHIVDTTSEAVPMEEMREEA